MDIYLRDVTDDDLPIFYEHQTDPVANQMVDYTVRSREDFMEHCARVRANASNTIKTIICDGQVAGNIACFFVYGRQEVGCWIGREFWGKGIATRALEMFLEHVRIRPLYGIAVRRNTSSQRVLEKCGFRVLSEGSENRVLVLE